MDKKMQWKRMEVSDLLLILFSIPKSHLGARECVEYVYSDTGLYPLPIARNCKSSHKSKIKNKFQFLGKFMAKAVLDNRWRDSALYLY